MLSSVSPKKSSRTGRGVARREQIEDAAADRVFARLHDRARTVKARRLQPLDDLLHRGPVAGGEPCR